MLVTTTEAVTRGKPYVPPCTPGPSPPPPPSTRLQVLYACVLLGPPRPPVAEQSEAAQAAEPAPGPTATLHLRARTCRRHACTCGALTPPVSFHLPYLPHLRPVTFHNSPEFRPGPINVSPCAVLKSENNASLAQSPLGHSLHQGLASCTRAHKYRLHRTHAPVGMLSELPSH